MNNTIKVWRDSNISKKIGVLGKIISWTVIRSGPEGFNRQTPYIVALVELETKNRMMMQIVDDCGLPIKTGQKVVTVVRRGAETDNGGVIDYALKAKVV